MIEEIARVQGVHADGSIDVITERQTACGQCKANQGCSTSVLSALLPKRSMTICLPTELKLQPGDQVVLGLSEKLFLFGTLMMYGMPLLALILGALLGQIISSWVSVSGEWLSIGVGLLAFLGTFYFLAVSHYGKAALRISPTVLRRV